jgi:hypothetical protein
MMGKPRPGDYDEEGLPLCDDEGDVWFAMMSSLQPLADWLEDGGALTPLLRKELVEALRTPTVEAAFRKANTASMADRRRWKREIRQAAIGAWVAVRVDCAARGYQPRVLFQARQTFNISESLAELCLTNFRKNAKLAWEEQAFNSQVLWERAFLRLCREREIDAAEARDEVFSGRNLGLKF